MPIRINKAIADAGFCSRRKADELIASGKVTINGEIAKIGQMVKSKDCIRINNKLLKKHEQITLMLNKPAGIITSKSDPHHKMTVMSLLPKELQHLKPAGRLDKESEGLLILSSDGDIIQKLTHPKHAHKKIYEIIVKGHAKTSDLEVLGLGKLKLDGYTLKAMKFRIMGKVKNGKTRISLELSEGRNRQIRRVMDKLGFPVLYLRRTQIGSLHLKNLPSGHYKILSQEELSLALS